MRLKQLGIGVLARALASSVAIGAVAFSATTASAALTVQQRSDANVLAEMIVTASLQANATPNNPNTTADETSLAIQAAIEQTIEKFQGGQADPGVVAEALLIAKSKLMTSGQWCPEAMASTSSSTKMHAKGDLPRGCSIGGAFAAVLSAVQTAQNGAPGATGMGGGPQPLPPLSGSGGGGGGVTHNAAQ